MRTNKARIHSAYRWLSSFELHGINKGLKNIQLLLKHLNWTQDGMKVVHVAGTNGKGSVCAILSSILRSAGMRVGFYHSPHLLKLEERFLVNNRLVSESLFLGGVDRVKKAYHQIRRKHPSFKPSYFEVATALAFWIFQKKEIDYLILETGMGGQWDSTNVVSSQIQIITNIEKDHTQHLGDSIQKITREKVGVLRSNSNVITAAKGSALRIIEKICRSHKSLLHVYAKNIQTNFYVADLKKQQFDVLVDGHLYDGLLLPLLGEHQMVNASLAICAIDILRNNGVLISKDNIREGLKRVYWPGRFQLLQRKPMLIVDGAHNPSAARELRRNIEKYVQKKVHLIFSAFQDKDVFRMIKALAPVVRCVTLVPIKAKRSQNLAHMKRLWERYLPPSEVVVKKKLDRVLDEVMQNQEPIVVCGSLYLVGEMFSILGMKTFKY